MATSANLPNTMSPGIPRWIFRWIHIILSIPIIGYVYSPFDLVHYYAPITRFIFVPILVLSGLWMWKGHLVRRIFSKKPSRGVTSYASR